MNQYKVLESENYIYKYFEPENPEDMAQILQITKSDGSKKWVREIDVWDDLEKAKPVFDGDDVEDYIK